MKSVVVGIDFGTSNSACCSLDENGCPKVLPIRGESANVPSIVILDEVATYCGRPAEILVSDAAKTAAKGKRAEFRALMPKVFREFKRRVGSSRVTWKLASGRIVRPVDLVTTYVRYLLEGAGLLDGKTAISSLCLTHPIGFSSGQLSELREALYRNGFCREIRMIPEPVAAAMGYEATHEELKRKRGVVVFDFGGGTLDVAYVTRNSEGKLIALRENAKGHQLQVGENIGGADIDMLLYQIAEQRIGSDPDAPIDPYLKMQCQKIKERLSFKEQDRDVILQHSSKQVDGVLQESTKEVQFSITRQEFLDALKRDVRILPSLRRALKSVLDAVAEDPDLAPVGCLLPIGGSCRLPIVQDLLNQMLPKDATLGELVPDDIAVAMGAAIYAQTQSVDAQIKNLLISLDQWVAGIRNSIPCV